MGITAGLPRKDLEHTGFKYPRILLLRTRGFRDTGDCRAQHGQEWKSLATDLPDRVQSTFRTLLKSRLCILE